MSNVAYSERTDSIKNLEMALFDYERKILEINNRMAEIRLEKKLIIEKKHEEFKPPELSNAEKRNLAINGLLEGDEEYKELIEGLEANNHIIRVCRIQVSFHKRQFARQYANALLMAARIDATLDEYGLRVGDTIVQGL